MSATYALFPDGDGAQRAVNALRSAGLGDADITVLSAEPMEHYEFGEMNRTTRIWYIAALGGLINALGQFLYVAVIHPAYADHFRAALVAGAKLTPEQAAEAQAQLDFVVSPAFRAINQGGTTLLFTLFVGVAYCFLFRDRASVPAAAPRA